jgi:hypothetical protein
MFPRVLCYLLTMHLVRFDNVWTALEGMESFFRILLEQVTIFSAIADSIIFSLLTCNLLAFGLLSYFVLRSVCTVLPTCQHRTITACLMHSLPVTALSRAHRLYAKYERGMETLNDEDAAKAGIEGMEDADDARAARCSSANNAATQQSPPEISTGATKGNGYEGFRGEGESARAESPRHSDNGAIAEGNEGGCVSHLNRAEHCTMISTESEEYSETGTQDSARTKEICVIPMASTKRRISFRRKVWDSFDEDSPLPFSSAGGSVQMRRQGSHSTQASDAPAISPGTPASSDSRKMNDSDSAIALLPLTAGNVMR